MRNSKSLSEDQISHNLLQIPAGHHYLILYSQLEKMRKVYSSYIKSLIESLPKTDTVIFFLPYYDRTTKVRKVLESKNIEVRKLEREGSLVLLDIVKVITDESSGIPEIERLRSLIKKLVKQNENKDIFVIADMSVFHHLRKSNELLDYEKTLHRDLKVERWKELCFYNESDFDVMFTQNQKDEMFGYHKDRVIEI